MPLYSSRSAGGDAPSGPIPFPPPVPGADREGPTGADDPPPSARADEALAAVETMSRKIEDLARELNCLGFFDGDDDRPRAA